MPSKVELVHRALSKIGQRPIASIDEESAPAKAALLVYDSVRREVLSSYSWAFAVRTVKLAMLSTVPLDYRFAFALPGDCLRAIKVTAPDTYKCPEAPDNRAFIVRGNELLTNLPAAILEYVADIDREEEFDARFCEAFVLKLASELSIPLGGKPDLMSSYSQQYEYSVRHAAAQSESQFYEEHETNPYLDARFM